MFARRLRGTRSLHAVAALTLVAAWVTVLAGNIAFYYRCEVDCGDGGARGLFVLLVLLVPVAVLGVRFLWRGRLSGRERLLTKLNAVFFGLVAIWIGLSSLPYPLWFFGAALPLAIVAAAAWQLARAP